jgi:hypothetical protein
MKKRLLAFLLAITLLTFTSTIVYAGDDHDPYYSSVIKNIETK